MKIYLTKFSNILEIPYKPLYSANLADLPTPPPPQPLPIDCKLSAFFVIDAIYSVSNQLIRSKLCRFTIFEVLPSDGEHNFNQLIGFNCSSQSFSRFLSGQCVLLSSRHEP